MATATSTLDTKTLTWMYKTMVTIRQFELRAFTEVGQRSLRGALHLSVGQEAVPTGICAHLTDDDYVLGTHRSHHHCIAKGVDLKEMLAELLGKAAGTNKGKGGTMHIADMRKGMLGANGVVGSNIPVATGAALSAKIRGTDQVSVVFFGDGAANQGSLHEAMNLASIWDLPVLFVCENNRYAEATPFEYVVAGGSVSNRAAGYAMPGVDVDGQSVPVPVDRRGTSEQDYQLRKLGPQTGLQIGDYVLLRGHQIPESGTSSRLINTTDKRLFQVHSAAGGDRSS